MKYNIILIATACFSFLACSNLDDSAYVIGNNDGSSVIFSEAFDSGLGEFIQKSDSGDQVWSANSNGYAMMTGYVNTANHANVDWLISPEIDLTSVAAAKLTFDHVARYFADVNNEATVWISEGYNPQNKPSSVTWTRLNTDPFSDPGSYTFGTSGEISLTSYVGKKVRIAFKYISSDSKAGTWEIKNFLVQKGEAAVSSEMFYSNSFAYGIGDFKAISVTGDQVWSYSSAYTCMTVSGYSSSNKANEDWLISPEIDLTSINESYFTFDHAGKYFNTPANEATVWVSENYTDNALPSTATWTQVNILNYFNNSSFTFVKSGDLDLTAYAGKKIHVALKYISTTATAGTWEVRNFQMFKGKAKGVGNNPFTITQAVGVQSGGSAWVEGYVVGYAWPYLSQYAYFNSADSCTQNTNIILSDTVSTTFYSSKSLCVQLPRGTMRNILNLKDNKSMLGKKIKVYGTLSAYMGMPGMVSPTAYVLPDGTSGTSTLTTLYSETFGTSLGSFTQYSAAGAQTWVWASGYGAKMSGYTSVNNVNEDWLISPSIDLTTATGAALKFDHAINKGVVTNMKTEQTLWISTDYTSGDPHLAHWTQLTIPTYPAGNAWTFVNSGEIALDAYIGKPVKIAFKYISTTSSSATWEVKNLLFYN